jgi:hypothetical protein
VKFTAYFPIGSELVGGTAIINDTGNVISADFSPYPDVNLRMANTIQTCINQLKRGKGSSAAKRILCVKEDGHKRGHTTTLGKLFDPNIKRREMWKTAKSLSRRKNRNLRLQPIDSKGRKMLETATPKLGKG